VNTKYIALCIESMLLLIDETAVYVDRVLRYSVKYLRATKRQDVTGVYLAL